MAARRTVLNLPTQSIRTYASFKKCAPSSKLRKLRPIPPPRDGVPRSNNVQRPQRQPSEDQNAAIQAQKMPQESPVAPTPGENISRALQEADATGENPLVVPVNMPDDPDGILPRDHPAISILENSAILIRRQLEWGSILVGFEQANRYVIMDPHGETIGYLVEQDLGLGKAVARQAFRTHRSFTAHIFDRNQKEVLRIHRPFSYINSSIRVYDCVSTDPGAITKESSAIGVTGAEGPAHISHLAHSNMRIIGEASQQWAPLRRKYNLFLPRDLAETNAPQLMSGDLPLSDSKALEVREDDSRQLNMVQFAKVDEPFLSWDFTLKTGDDQLIGSVNREFGNLGRELFADAGTYALRMDSAQTEDRAPGMTLDQRAVMLATAVSIDFDYFSRRSGAFGGLPIPIWIPMGGGAGAEAGAAGAGEAGAAGAAGLGEAGAAGGLAEAGAGGLANAGRGAAGAWGTEAGVAGAGTIAGYEAMQRGRGSQTNEPFDDASPQTPGGHDGQVPQGAPGQQSEDAWSESWDWDDKTGGQSPPSTGGHSGGSGEGGGGLSDFFDDFF